MKEFYKDETKTSLFLAFEEAPRVHLFTNKIDGLKRMWLTQVTIYGPDGKQRVFQIHGKMREIKGDSLE
jgi:hypothetical protein